MAKNYELMASRYDKYNRNKYSDEKVVKVEGVNLSRLPDIDKFTAGYNIIEFSKLLGSEYDNSNMFSIRVTDTRDNSCYYLKAIFDDKNLVEAIGEMRKKTIHTASGNRTIEALSMSNPLVAETFSPIKKALENRNYEEIKDLIKTRKDYMWKLRRFTEAAYDEGEEVNDLRELQEEFCDYQVFRSAYTFKAKKQIKNVSITRNVTNLRKKIVLNTRSTARVTFQSALDKFVDYNKESDKEEFLDEGEISTSYGDADPYFERSHR